MDANQTASLSVDGEAAEKIAAATENVLTGGIAGDRLKSYVERIERLAQERDAINEDIREIYIEVKSAGFDIKALRRLVADRKAQAKDAAGYREQLELFNLYKTAMDAPSRAEAA